MNITKLQTVGDSQPKYVGIHQRKSNHYYMNLILFIQFRKANSRKIIS